MEDNVDLKEKISDILLTKTVKQLDLIATGKYDSLEITFTALGLFRVRVYLED